MQSQIDDWQAAYNKSRDGGVKVRSKYEQLKDDGFEDDGFEEVEVRASDSKAAAEASNGIKASPQNTSSSVNALPPDGPDPAQVIEEGEESVTESEGEDEVR